MLHGSRLLIFVLNIAPIKRSFKWQCTADSDYQGCSSRHIKMRRKDLFLSLCLLLSLSFDSFYLLCLPSEIYDCLQSFSTHYILPAFCGPLNLKFSYLLETNQIHTLVFESHYLHFTPLRIWLSSRVRFPMVSLWSNYDPGVDLASNISEYQEYFLGGKSGRCLGFTTLPPLCANCLEFWTSQPPRILRACPGLYWDCFSLLFPFLYLQNISASAKNS